MSTSGGVLAASLADTDCGSCKASLIASLSRRALFGKGVWNRGGRGGAEVVVLSLSKMDRGGGGKGPAVACTPG